MIRPMTRLTIDLGSGRTAKARPGDVLLDAVLRSGHALPHDCRSGICGTCRVDVTRGQVIGADGPPECGVLACQTRVLTDVAVDVPDRPRPDIVNGRVLAVEDLSADVVGVTIEPREAPWHLPGQYCQFLFHGLPPRAYSPTLPLTGGQDPALIQLHVRRVPGGLVSQAFGRTIRRGHRVRIAGPFGSAVLERGGSGPIVAVGTGTGFAPIWSVVHAALVEQPDREITVIAGARHPDQAYMEPALARLSVFPRVKVLRAVDDPAGGEWAGAVRGTPVDLLPPLLRGDVVFAAGAPAMVEAIRRICLASGARIRADSFGPAPRMASEAACATPVNPAGPSRTVAEPELAPDLEPLALRRDARHGSRARLTTVVGIENTDFGQARALARRIAAKAPCLLIDGDLDGRRGLTDVVCRGVSLLAAVDRPAGSALHVLSLGTGDPNDVLHHPERLARVMDLLTSSYEAIVVSSPPLTCSPLGQVMAAVADTAVITAENTADPRVRLAAGSLRSAGASEAIVLADRMPRRPAPGGRTVATVGAS